MKGYDILTEIRKLTPEQQDYFLQHLLGKMSMDFEGFQDSPTRPEHLYAKYVFDNMDDSMTRARLGDIARPLPVCDKHGVHMTDVCQQCAYEGDHPPIEPKGADDLSPEQLQSLHRQQLVPTADSIENIDPFVVQQEVEKPPVWHTACHDCGSVVYPLEVGRRYPATQTGVKSPDGLIRCKVCNDKTLSATRLLEGTPCSMPKQIMIDGLKVSTDTLAYHLIPVIAIQRLCERIMLGEETKGKDAWNALSDNQAVLDSKKALARRFGHTINHAYRLLGKIQRGESWTEEDEREASAVMWGGMYAICAINQQRKEKECNT